MLFANKTTLKKNSTYLEHIHHGVCTNYIDLEIELKYTLGENNLLCGITMDGKKYIRLEPCPIKHIIDLSNLSYQMKL